jgi:hypothetical protein
MIEFLKLIRKHSGLVERVVGIILIHYPLIGIKLKVINLSIDFILRPDMPFSFQTMKRKHS